MSDLPPPPPSDGPPPPPPPPGGYAQPVGGTGMVQKAGFGVRFGAWLIDALIIGVPFGIINLVVQNSVPTEIVLCRNDTALCEQPTGAGWAIIGLVSLIQLAVSLWYYATFEGTKTQTIGKKAVGIRVVDVATGDPIGNGRGVGRYFARWLSAIPCLLGYFWMLWDDQKQTWHDKLTNAHVIRA